MKKFSAFDWAATILLVVGGLNWGFLGLFGINIIGAIFGEMTAISRIIYSLVGLSAVYAIFIPARMGSHEFMHGGETMRGST